MVAGTGDPAENCEQLESFGVIMPKKLCRLFLAALLSLSAAPSLATYDINIPKPETVIADQIYNLHLYILAVCAVIFVVVFGWMFLVLLKLRKSVGHEAEQFN